MLKKSEIGKVCIICYFVCTMGVYNAYFRGFVTCDNLTSINIQARASSCNVDFNHNEFCDIYQYNW